MELYYNLNSCISVLTKEANMGVFRMKKMSAYNTATLVIPDAIWPDY